MYYFELKGKFSTNTTHHYLFLSRVSIFIARCELPEIPLNNIFHGVIVLIFVAVISVVFIFLFS